MSRPKGPKPICSCGKKVATYHSVECNDCIKQKYLERQLEYKKLLEKGTCPQCGSKLRSNSSLYGWIQCGCYGVEHFRHDEDKGKPTCGFQFFWDPKFLAVNG